MKRARKILSRYDGVMVADSVGLGKTWIGKKLLEDFAYHLRQKALIICPAALRNMWERELATPRFRHRPLARRTGTRELRSRALGDTDVMLIDESHNFRNPTANRYANLERLLGANGAGERRRTQEDYSAHSHTDQ